MNTRLRDDVLSTIQTFVLLTAMVLFFGLTAKAQSVTVTKVAPTSSAALKVVSSDPSRSSVVFENVGSVNVGFGGSAVTYATGMVVAPNQYLKCVGNNDAMYGIAASSTADVRVIATYISGQRTSSTPYCEIGRLTTTGGAINTAAANTVGMSDGSGNIVPGSVIFKFLTTAITANSTTCSDASGSMAITSNATGLGSMFRCDGTNYQLVANYVSFNSGSAPITVATTSTSDMYFTAPVTGTLAGVDFSSLDALAASDTNYITFTGTNLGQSGVGSTAVLLVGDANTTKTTGGTALVALARRQLTLHGTAGNLEVTKGDVIRIRATVTGTLVGAVTLSRVTAYFTKLS